MKQILIPEEVFQLYTVDKLSQRQIAKIYGVDRTAVSHCMKRYGIEARESTGTIGEGIAANKIQQAGFVVVDMNERSKLHPFDLLISGNIRADVKTSHLYKNHWVFTLTCRPEIGLSTSHYIRLPNGRMRKKYTESCDFLMFIGFIEDSAELFIVPASEVREDQQTVSIHREPGHRWWEYHDRFDLLHEFIGGGQTESSS